MRVNILVVLVGVLFIASCSAYKSRIPRNPTHTGQEFTVSNAKKEMLFEMVAPNGKWETYDRSKEERGRFFQFRYIGPNSAVINAEIRISFGPTSIPVTPEEGKNITRISEQEKWLEFITAKIARPLTYIKPKNMISGIRKLAGIQCGYYSYENHSGPALDTPTVEFRGMGSFRKEENYSCPVMRDDKLWYFSVTIVYQYSDLITKKNLNIGLQKTIKDFDRMIKPTLDSLKLYGDLKQY